MAGERTENPYRTYGPPDTGESWAEYFRRIRSASDVGSDAIGDDSDSAAADESGGVLMDRGSLDEYDTPRSAVTYLNLLAKNGFQTNSGWSRKFFEGGVYGPTAQKAGEKKPDRTIDTVWIEAISEDHRRLVRFTYEKVNDGKFTCTWRQINKQYKPVSDKELKEFINGTQ